jgi:glucoamylase
MMNKEQKPYLIGAITGNSRLLAGLSEKGQLERLFWPRIDTPQNIGHNWLGLVIDDEKTCWMSYKEWKSKQFYDGDTNILKTVLYHQKHQLEVVITDFAAPNKDLLVRQVRVINESKSKRRIQVMLYSEMMIGENHRYHTTVFLPEEKALWQFKQNSHFIIGSDQEISGFQCGKAMKNANKGRLELNRQAMAPDGALAWELGTVSHGEEAAITIYTAMGQSLEGIQDQLVSVRIAGYQRMEDECRDYWQEYLAKAGQVETGNSQLDALYRRSLLVFHLMTDKEHGSMLAAPEFDEDFTTCGGYSYCWGRDAAYITYAIDRAGMKEAARCFYRWTIKAQNSNGAWEQRHYLDGAIAPNWGLQVDETGSIIWGMWQHYLLNKEEAALLEFWPSISLAAEFLVGFINENTGLPYSSMDLWEERSGEHTYSAVAVWAGLCAAAQTAEELGYSQQAKSWQQVSDRLKSTIEQRLWSEKDQCFLRGIYPQASGDIIEDGVVDVSLLGLVFPFAFLPADDPRMIATAKEVEKRLTSPKVGGIKRYEDDEYIGGNPWILCTLWLALYYVELGNHAKAEKLLKWAVQHQTHSGLLPEQVDRDTGKTAWVVPLTWSHAMLVLTVLKLFPRKKQ